MNLTGRIALVTGGTRGMGEAIVRKLTSEGTIVHSVSRSEGVDLHSEGAIANFFYALPALDILVNCVGGMKRYAPFPEMTDDDWMEAFEDNVMTAVRVTRAALPLLGHSNHAVIVNIASISAHDPSANTMPYGAAKAALISFTKSLAEACRGDGIRVNAVCPSAVKGDRWTESVSAKAGAEGISLEEADRIMQAQAEAKSSIGRMYTPEDVANTVAMLAADDGDLKQTGKCIDLK